MFKKFLGRLPLSLLLIFFFNFKCTGIFLVDAFLFLNSSILLWVNNRKIKLSFPHLLSFLLLHMLSDPAQMEYTLRLAHWFNKTVDNAAFVVSRRFYNWRLVLFSCWMSRCNGWYSCTLIIVISAILGRVCFHSFLSSILRQSLEISHACFIWNQSHFSCDNSVISDFSL